MSLSVLTTLKRDVQHFSKTKTRKEWLQRTLSLTLQSNTAQQNPGTYKWRYFNIFICICYYKGWISL